MKTLFDEVLRLRLANARHRKGFTMQQATPQLVASHASIEAAEVLEAVLWEQLDNENANHVLEECADVVAALIHLLIMYGFNENDLEAEVLRKMKLRFTEPESCPKCEGYK